MFSVNNPFKFGIFSLPKQNSFLNPFYQYQNYRNFTNTIYNSNKNGNITFPRQGLKNLRKGSLTNLHNFNGKLLMLGFGAIGEGTLPLILRHINMPLENIHIVTAPDRELEAKKASERFGISSDTYTVTKTNYESLLKQHLKPVDVSSLACMEWCHQNNVLYLDTVIEPWKGLYYDTSLSISDRSNYRFREDLLKLKSKLGNNNGPTAVSCHGANPGMVSHFVKQALLNIAQDTNYVLKQEPKTKQAWAKLSKDLGIKVIHVAERDAQTTYLPKKRNEFVNTWSVEGFISEGCQPAELGWGTHEKYLPYDGEHHSFGKKNAIYLKQPGCFTKVRSWAPNEGSYHGFLITHNESITISDYLTVYDEHNTNKAIYRPTVHYSYHPCDQAVLSLHEFIGKNYQPQENFRILCGEQGETLQGIDELGVLLCGHKKNAYWYGSQLSANDAREMIENNQATSLQVTSSCFAGVVWTMKNPKRGIVESEDMDFKSVLEIIEPYISPMVGVYSDWQPIQNRGHLFPDDRDMDDPWQFYNIRVREMAVPKLKPMEK